MYSSPVSELKSQNSVSQTTAQKKQRMTEETDKVI